MTTVWNLDHVIGVASVVLAVLSLTAGALVTVAGYRLEQIRAARRQQPRPVVSGPRFAPGVQPACEFTAVVSDSLYWQDPVLAAVVEQWQRELGGGVR